jgi:hypothetical protein
LGIPVDGRYSPDVLQRMVCACVQSISSRDAVKHLEKLAGLSIERRQLERWTQPMGEVRIEQREQQVEQWIESPLPQGTRGCPLPKTPEAVMISMDGGRLQILDRCGESLPEETEEERTAEPLLEEDVATPLLPLHARPGLHLRHLAGVCRGDGGAEVFGGLAGVLPLGSVALERSCNRHPDGTPTASARSRPARKRRWGDLAASAGGRSADVPDQ